MTVKEVVDTFLRLLEILVPCVWPITLLLLMFAFRRQIRSALPRLEQRLKKAEIAGTKLEFSEVAISALQDAIETGAEEYKDESDKLVVFVREQFNKLPAIETSYLSSAAPTLVGRSILWVDDKPMNNVYESSIFKRLGASIVSARSTTEALAFLSQVSYDLIISDVHRVEDGRSNPNAGYELLDKLTEVHPDTPLIFYTGSVARMDKSRSRLAYGAADYPTPLVNLVLQALGAS